MSLRKPSPESAEPKMGANKLSGPTRTTLGRLAAENIECLAIAIVMALILKYFLIEAYKIPTGSMQPTIIGDSQTGIFDRVLVNKLSYLIDDPDRWDVIVFKYPLDLQKNYIKRMIGLENERIRIARGDIFVSKKQADGTYGEEKVARKPKAVRESVLKTVFPGPVEGEIIGDFFNIKPAEDQGSPPKVEDGIIRVTSESGASVGAKKIIRDRYYHGYHPKWIAGMARGRDRHTVTDLGLRFRIEIDDGKSGSIKITLGEGDIDHIVNLDFGGTSSQGNGSQGNGSLSIGSLSTGRRVGAEKRQETLISDLSLEGGTTYDLGFLNIDDQLILEIDGDEVATLEYETDDFSSVQYNAIGLEIKGMSATIQDLEVVRDIYYLPATNRRLESTTFDVPDGHFFALGDNTQNSSDGREWQLATYEAEDSSSVSGNYFPEDRVGPREDANPRFVDGHVMFRDIYGEPHILRGNLRAQAYKELEYHRFVDKDYLLGKAMAVFWPIPPFSPTLRWKLVR